MADQRYSPSRRAGGQRRAVPPVPKRRAVRPRYGRIAAASASALVTMVALLAGVGVLPMAEVERPTYAQAKAPTAVDVAGELVQSSTGASAEVVARARERDRLTEAERRQAARLAARRVGEIDLPAESGRGRRAVFDISAQRAWIVGADDEVQRTYLVSGSLLDNLDPGTYEVFSRSRHAVGIDDSGEMEYFVRFTRGDNAAIGFHSIPTKDGEPLQTRAELGTPQSHGCIRQARPDAVAMWEFAQLGTTVVVTS